MKNYDWPPPETMAPALAEYRKAREALRKEEALRTAAMEEVVRTDWTKRAALVAFHARQLEMRVGEGRLLRAKEAIFSIIDAMIDGPEQMKGPPVAEVKGAAAGPPQMTASAAPEMTNVPTAKEIVRKAMLENPLDIDGDEDDAWLDDLDAGHENGDDER